mgnify:CR=1 FL=1
MLTKGVPFSPVEEVVLMWGAQTSKTTVGSNWLGYLADINPGPVMIVFLLSALDQTIVSTAMPTIIQQLNGLELYAWVTTSYLLASTVMVPIWGKLGDLYGRKLILIIGIAIFVGGSWLCGLAPTMPLLIAARALQGFVAGPMIPLSQALLLASYPRAMAGMAVALWSMTTLVAPVMGPLLGGWITDNFSWPWIFYINVPFGIIAAFAVLGIYRHRESVIRRVPIDRIGLALIVIWVGSLQMMLDLGKELDWFGSPLVVALGVAAAVGLAFFLAWELTEEHPVVDLRLFAGRNFWAGTLVTSVGYGLFFGNVVLVPLWLQQFMGYTATDAGLVTAPVGLLALLLSPLVGRTVGRVDPRRYATFAFLVFAGVLWLRSLFNTQADMATILLPTFLQGAAMAFFFIPMMTLTLAGLPPARVAAASGLSNFARITCGAVGTSVATTVWEDRAALHHAHLSEAIHAGSPQAQSLMQGLAASGLSPQQALAQANRLVDQQAFMLAADDIFWLSSLLFLALIPFVWLTRAPRRTGSEAPDRVALPRANPPG